MAAEVGTRAARRMDDEAQGNGSKQELITRDLLGSCSITSAAAGSMELDLDLHVPPGWERHLDLLSGKTYLHKCSVDPPAIDFRSRRRQLEDLNLPPPLAAAAAPDLGLAVPSNVAAGSNRYQSICTLETVKFAVDRADRESRIKQTMRSGGSASPCSSTTSSSLKRRGQQIDDAGSVDGSDSAAPAETMMEAAGCPGCLLYVLISRQNPRCPRCETRVPLPPPLLLPMKKLRIDLNDSSPSSSSSEFW